LQYIVVGAGAIGGTIGAHMVRAGHAVTFVDRDADHVRAIADRGLTIRGFRETFSVRAPACTPDRLEGPVEAILLAVKAQHTEEALAPLAPKLAPNGFVVSLQNGLCETVIARLVGEERTVGAFVNFGADYLEPGRIHFGGMGAFRVGELDGRRSDRVQRLRDVFSCWGPVTVTDNIWGYLWSKMGYANMAFATALVDADAGEVIDRYRLLMAALMAEIFEVAEREGVRLEPFDQIDPPMYYPRNRPEAEVLASFEPMVHPAVRSEKRRTGIWRDLAVRHRPTEVDMQIGVCAEIGARHGLPLPLTHRLIAMVHEIERGERGMAWENVDELNRMRASVANAP
jgi:2-dehydropantoate 2-reductase